MSTKVAPTRRTNKAPAKRRASAPARHAVKVVKRTEADVYNAVERSLDVLRYRYSRETAESVITAWATLRALNTYLPHVAREHPALNWEYVRKHPDLMMVTAMASLKFEDSMWGKEECYVLSWIGCVQATETVRALHRIWDPFSEPVEFDFLGVVVMALRHN